MEKLYYEDSYIKTFTAEIINVLEKNGEFHVVLDKTYFYPEGGGQICDIGFIENMEITSVYENDSIIYHVTSKKPMKIHKVKCSIDFDKRFDNMQQHLGQHILSASIADLFNGITVSFHLGKESSTIDVDKFLDLNQIDEAVSFANRIIMDSISVEVLYPTKSELKKMPIKKEIPKTNEQIRIVKIGDLDFNPCCGLHPKSTIEVQLIKVKKIEKNKTNTRIEFLCGKRAVLDSFSKDRFAMKICNSLKCNENDALAQIEKLSADCNKLFLENRVLKSEIADYEVKYMIESSEKMNDISIIKQVYTDVDLKYVNLLATKLTSYEKVIVIFAIKNGATANLIFMCSKDLKVISMNMLLKDAISLIDGKGGGSDFSAQGGGKNSNNVESAMDYALMKIRERRTEYEK